MRHAPRASNTCPLINIEPFVAVTAITRKLDKIALSINGTDNNLISLINMLNQIGFVTVQDGFAANSNYRRTRKLIGFDGITLILLRHPKKPFLPIGRLEIHDPTADFMEFLNSAIDHVHLYAKVSVAEVALDMKAGRTYLLAEYIKDHLYLPYQRKPSGSYEDLTFYSTDIYRAAKGHRLYPKTVDGNWVLRLELQLNRPVLKRLGVMLPNAHSLLTNLDLRTYIQFKHIDVDGLAKFMSKRNHHPSRHAAIHEGLVKSQLQSWLTLHGQELMPQIEQMRRLEPGVNLSRFVVRDSAFEDLFFAHLT